MTPDVDLVRRLEDAGFRAWPAREEIRIGGWRVRLADGHTGRANSVNPMGPVDDLDASIRRCEELFRSHRLRPVFRATPLLEPPELVDALRERDYALVSPTRVLTRDLSARPPEAVNGVSWSDAPDGEWLGRLVRWYAVPTDRQGALRAILEAIEPARAFATVRDGDTPVGAGVGVTEGGLVGLFDLVTAPESRDRGHGTRLVEGVLGWGVARGARVAYLQVEEDNEGARRLYGRLGFEDAYSYGYWVSREKSPYDRPKAAPLF